MLSVQAATAAVKSNPRDPNAWALLGDAFAEAGDNEKARKSYLEALKHDPSHAGALEAIAWLDSAPLPDWFVQAEQVPHTRQPSPVASLPPYVPPPLPLQPTPRGHVRQQSPFRQSVGIVGAVFLALGCFAPLLRGFGVSFSYIQGDGIVVVGLAVLSFLLVLARSYLLLWLPTIVAGAIVGNTFYRFSFLSPGDLQPGWGWFIVGMGLFLLVVCALLRDGTDLEGPMTMVQGLLVLVSLVGASLWCVYSFRRGAAELGTPARTPIPAITRSVSYNITGSASRAAITYENPEGEHEEETIELPWGKTFQFEESSSLYLSARNLGSGGTLICQISVDGRLWQHRSVSEGDTVSCGASELPVLQEK